MPLNSISSTPRPPRRLDSTPAMQVSGKPKVDIAAEARKLSGSFNQTSIAASWLFGEWRPSAEEIRATQTGFVGRSLAHLSNGELVDLGADLVRRASNFNPFDNLGLSPRRLHAVGDVVLTIAQMSEGERAEFLKEPKPSSGPAREWRDSYGGRAGDGEFGC